MTCLILENSSSSQMSLYLMGMIFESLLSGILVQDYLSDVLSNQILVWPRFLSSSLQVATGQLCGYFYLLGKREHHFIALRIYCLRFG